MIAVVNAFGDILEGDGTIIAGAHDANGFVGSAALSCAAARVDGRPGRSASTTLVAIVTSAKLDKLGLTGLARQAHDGMAHAISPVHTAFDGDTVFALSTGDDEADPNDLRHGPWN